MMNDLQSDSFDSTQRHARSGKGNTDPRRAYLQQPAVELSSQGLSWLNDRLERAFSRHGKLSAAALAGLDWPETVEAAGTEEQPLGPHAPSDN